MEIGRKKERPLNGSETDKMAPGWSRMSDFRETKKVGDLD